MLRVRRSHGHQRGSAEWQPLQRWLQPQTGAYIVARQQGCLGVTPQLLRMPDLAQCAFAEELLVLVWWQRLKTSTHKKLNSMWTWDAHPWLEFA